MSSPEKKLACFCNNIPYEAVEAWTKGSKSTSLSDLQDETQAGCGPCGGSCRPILTQIVNNAHQKTPAPKGTLPPDFVKAISLFNRRYYWETHEILEDLWMEEVGKTKTFYQAIIQGAAALYHVLNANPKGVIKLSGDSLAKILGPRENPWEIDITPLISALNSYKTQAEEILGQTRSGFDYACLPQIRLDEHLVVDL